MLCSICRKIEIVVNDTKAKTCPREHVYCEKCTEEMDGICPICEGQLKEYDGAHELWPHLNGMNLALSENRFQDDMDGLAKDNEAASVNLLHFRAVPQLQSSDCTDLSDASLNRNDVKQQQFSRSVKIPTNSNQTDIHQSLIERTKQELRQKITDDNFKPYRTDQRPITQLRTIEVSTDSTPKLSTHNSTMPSSPESTEKRETTKRQTLHKKVPPEYLLMNVHTRTVGDASDVQKKSETSSTDLRLQQIMGTVLESAKPPTKDDQHFNKLIREKFSHDPLNKLEEIISSIDSEDDDEVKTEVHTLPDESSKHPVDTLIANSRRAFFNPPTDVDTPPEPQSQNINLCSDNMSSELLQTEILDGTLNIPRRPIICPISTCQRTVFVSNFTKHIAVDHTNVSMEGIYPQQCKNFLLDPKLIHLGAIRCQLLLLVKNKITNLGHDKFKEFVPILVMTTKLSLLEICYNKHQIRSEQQSTQNFIMIWLTSIMPPNLPIFFNLTVWARSRSSPACHLVHTGRLYSLREPQSPETVRQSGQMMLLSHNQIDLLTNGGRNMLELQISVH